MNKQWYIYKMDYYTMVRTNEPQWLKMIQVDLTYLVESEKVSPKGLYTLIKFGGM